MSCEDGHRHLVDSECSHEPAAGHSQARVGQYHEDSDGIPTAVSLTEGKPEPKCSSWVLLIFLAQRWSAEGSYAEPCHSPAPKEQWREGTLEIPPHPFFSFFLSLEIFHMFHPSMRKILFSSAWQFFNLTSSSVYTFSKLLWALATQQILLWSL